MTRTRIAAALALSLLMGSAAALRADVRTEERTKFQLAGMLGKIVNIFGGKGAREGVVSTVAVKGDRKMTTNESTGQIIDLAEEKVYDLDLKKKTYKVTTFADLRRKFEEDRHRAEENAQRQEPKEKAAPKKDEKQMEVDFSVKNTGEKKVVNGFDARQSIATITVREKGKTLEESGGLVMTSDMWLAPRIAAMKEVADFDRRYAQKLYGPMIMGASAQDMAAAMAMYPMMKPAMEKWAAEGSKIDGTAVMTTVTMDAVKSAEQLAEEKKNAASSDDSKSSTPTSIGGIAGGFLKKKMQKKNEDEAAGPQARATFMTTTLEVLKVTTDVGAADVAIPMGFKENK
jgi:hypothetical protein